MMATVRLAARSATPSSVPIETKKGTAMPLKVVSACIIRLVGSADATIPGGAAALGLPKPPTRATRVSTTAAAPEISNGSSTVRREIDTLSEAARPTVKGSLRKEKLVMVTLPMRMPSRRGAESRKGEDDR